MTNAHQFMIGLMLFLLFCAFITYLECRIALYIMKYHTDDKGISVINFGFIRTDFIPYSNIDSIKLITFRELFNYLLDADYYDVLSSVNLSINRISKNEMVIIKKKKWFLFKYIIISPDNPNEFIEQVMHHFENPG